MLINIFEALDDDNDNDDDVVIEASRLCSRVEKLIKKVRQGDVKFNVENREWGVKKVAGIGTRKNIVEKKNSEHNVAHVRQQPPSPPQPPPSPPPLPTTPTTTTTTTTTTTMTTTTTKTTDNHERTERCAIL
ncbi:hypothetical protein M0804_006574 [Polistes exclamans]|nr:hypothetical protein M0804_006574 [Polistes exclamans]